MKEQLHTYDLDPTRPTNHRTATTTPTHTQTTKNWPQRPRTSGRAAAAAAATNRRPAASPRFFRASAASPCSCSSSSASSRLGVIEEVSVAPFSSAAAASARLPFSDPFTVRLGLM